VIIYYYRNYIVILRMPRMRLEKHRSIIWRKYCRFWYQVRAQGCQLSQYEQECCQVWECYYQNPRARSWNSTWNI